MNILKGGQPPYTTANPMHNDDWEAWLAKKGDKVCSDVKDPDICDDQQPDGRCEWKPPGCLGGFCRKRGTCIQSEGPQGP